MKKVLAKFLILFFLLFLLLIINYQIILAASSSFRVEIIPGPECYDGIDNDGDGKIDFPEDEGCSSKSDDSEEDVVTPYCGDGTCNGDENCSNCPVDCGDCPSGGGGGGGSIIEPATGVNFSGRAYPMSKVVVLKDGQEAITTIAGPDAKFRASLTNLSPGDYNFLVYGEDNKKRRSSPFPFSINVTKGASTNISGIFIAPTIDLSKSEVKKGNNIAIFGQTAPESEVTIAINSEENFFKKTDAGKDGAYLYNLDTSILEKGRHKTKTKSAIKNEISSYGRTVAFFVGDKDIIKSEADYMRGDLNGDKRVNLIDFSIAAFWHEKILSNNFEIIEKRHLNGDKKINLIDFSIMAYYWTG